MSAVLGPHVKHSRANPCPTCGGDNCVTFEDGAVLCLRAESPHRTKSGIGWLHPTDADTGVRRDRRPRPATDSLSAPPPPASPDPAVLDRALRVLLAACPLSPAHRTHLRGRGLTDAEIGALPFGTLPAGEEARNGVAAQLVAAVGPDAFGNVPGLYADDAGAPRLHAHPGLLIGVLAGERLVGAVVRPDDEAARAGGKYRWLSSGAKPGGVGSGAPCGLLLPPGWAAGTPAPRAIVAEGILKGYVVAARTGLPVVAIPGATITADVPRRLAEVGATEATLAFDNDRATNPAVARAEADLIDALHTAGVDVTRATWPATFKGLDDALAAGILPVLEVPAAVACAAALAEKEREIAALRDALAAERRRYAELSALHSAALAAHRSPHLGPERATATALVIDLSAAPRGEWRPTPHARIAEGAGVSHRAVPRHLKTVGPILEGAVELKTVWVPEAHDPATGRVTGGHKQTMARLVAEPIAALRVIATGMPVKGHKNGNGGRRVCPDCGDVGTVKRWTVSCLGCGQVLDRGEERTAPGDGQSVGTPGVGAGAPRTAAPPAGDGQSVSTPPPAAVPPSLSLSSGDVHSSATLATSHNEEPAWLADAPDPTDDDALAPVAGDADAVAVLDLDGAERVDGHRGAGPVRAALAGVEAADDPDAFRRANGALAAQLAAIARARGRTPVPKPRAAPLPRAEPDDDPFADDPVGDDAGPALPPLRVPLSRPDKNAGLRWEGD